MVTRVVLGEALKHAEAGGLQVEAGRPPIRSSEPE